MSQSSLENTTPYSGHVPILWRPFHQFSELQTASGIVLILCTLAALIWANSPWGSTYEEFWHTGIAIKVGAFELDHSLAHWINDGMMAIFFLLVGLEIKREMLAGELADLRKALLPILAAVGGMVLPAGIYLALNYGGVHAKGWGIPMATDIAFALGILSLLGNRVPVSLKVFLAALAIIDDIGAVLVIAFFYTAHIDWMALVAAGTVLLLLAGMNLAHVRRPFPYLFVGVFLWLAFLKSGVHASIAGVVLAFLIPHKSELEEWKFPDIGGRILESFKAHSPVRAPPILDDNRIGAIHAMEQACEDVEPCLQRLERKLHPWVAFFILPLFALANAGVVFGSEVFSGLGAPLGLGILLGLVLGKPIGIMLFSALAIRLGWSGMPAGASYVQMFGVGLLGGIGFTMSIFISGLAFEDAGTLAQAKMGILAASLIAGIAGYALLRSVGKSTPRGNGNAKN